jgi:hypothetical protein
VPISLPPPLRAALVALAERLDGAAIDWVVGGGTARALLGFDTEPQDLDIEVDEGATHRAAVCVGLVEHREDDAAVESIRAQGDWHGVALDISGGITFHGPGGNLHADFPLLRLFAKPVTVDGRVVWAMPVEEQIARSVVAGAGHRLDRIADERPADYVVDDVYLSLRLAAAASST